MSVFNKIFSNTAIPVAGKLVSVLISIFLIKILSNNLGVDGFGYYITIFEFIAIFAAISDFGIYAATVRELSVCDKSEAPRILGNVLGMTVAISIGAMLMASIIVSFVGAYSDTPILVGVWMATVMIVISAIAKCMKSILQVHYQIQYATLAGVAGKLIRFVWIALVIMLINPSDIAGLGIQALFGVSVEIANPLAMSIYWVVAGFTAASIVEYIITYIYASRVANISYRFEMAYWKPFLRRALPYGLAIMLGEMYFRIDILLLSLLKGPEDVGLYGIAMRLVENGTFIAVVFANALLPALAAALNEDNRRVVADLVRKSWLFLLSMSLPLALLATAYAVPLTLLFSSHDYLTSDTVPFGSDVAIQVSVWALMFFSLNRLFVFATLAMGKEIKILVINGFGVLINLVANLIFIPKYGILAAAVTTVISEAIVLALNFAVVWNSTHIKIPVARSLAVVWVALSVFGVFGLIFHLLWDPESIAGMFLLATTSCVVYLLVLRFTALRSYLGAIPALVWSR